MKYIARIGILVAAALVLAGCAQVPRQAYNARASGHVKKVLLAQQVNQDEYQINILGHPGMSFGLIGGLVAAADMQAKTTRLTTAIDPGETRIQDRFSQKLRERLEATGYETRVVTMPKGTTFDQALAQAKQAGGADAVVAIDLYAGYWAAGPTTDYFPRMLVKVKALDAKSHAVLYEDSISYGYAAPQAQTVHLASANDYRFANVDMLVANPTKARQGLYRGVDALVEQIANDLKR